VQSGESSTPHDPGGGGCCAAGSDILEVVIAGALLVAMQLSISETSSTSPADDQRFRLVTFSERL
jgi:hypothetical protein